jgi:signal transduction histidine kinase
MAILSRLLKLIKLPDEEMGLTQKRLWVLTNRMGLLAIVLNTPFYLIELSLNSTNAHWPFVIFTSIYLLTIVLNVNGYSAIAKIIGLFMFNGILFVICASPHPRAVHPELHFISAAIVAIILFGFVDKKFGIIFTIIPICAYIASTKYPITLFETHGYTSSQVTFLFALNLTVFVILNFSLIFMLLRINAKVERKLLAMNMELMELNDSKDKLFSIIGHDLKGPLNSLSAFSSLLAVNAVNEDEIKMLSKSLTNSINNAKGLLEDLLEWAQSQAGLTEFEFERFDLSLIIKENIELLALSANGKKITLTSNIQEEVFVNVHRYSINMVIRNLLSNAIKFTKEGGSVAIFITISNQVTVSVKDTGVGIAPETVKQLFQLGKRVSTPGTANEKGTGLGLILCKEFIEKNGGSMGVETEEGVGSRFYFTLPNG